MAVLYIYESPDVKLENYDKISADVREHGMPEGCISHVACPREGGGLVVVELWDSEEANAKWAQILEAKIAAVGGPARPKPRTLQVRNVMLRETSPARL